MSNFADMAYDNYLMHYRTKGSRGDLGGMPSSAREVKEKAERASEIKRLSKQKSKGDYAGMPSSARAAKERVKEEKRDRMKASAEAKRKAEYMKAKAEAKRKKESEINKLSKQASRGDYAGMPSSVKEAQARAKEEKRDRMKSNAEAKRKKESEIDKFLEEKDEKGQTSKSNKKSAKGWWSEQLAMLEKWGIPTDEAYLEKQGIRRYSHSKGRKV